jgi:uncharacterized membrane protein
MAAPDGSNVPTNVRPLASAAIVLGLGLGGFVDGIVFHQVLQWHHMATSHADPTVAGDLGLNMRLDGLFHAATWLLVALGLALLHRAWRRADGPPDGRVLLGGLLAGWGIFNLVEGVVDHHLLGIHHVHPSGALAWDLAFLAFGAALVLGGWSVARAGARGAGARKKTGTRAGRA